MKVPDSESARMALPQRQLNYRQDWTAVWRNWESALLLLYFSSVPDEKKSQKERVEKQEQKGGKKEKNVVGKDNVYKERNMTRFSQMIFFAVKS